MYPSMTVQYSFAISGHCFLTYPREMLCRRKIQGEIQQPAPKLLEYDVTDLNMQI